MPVENTCIILLVDLIYQSQRFSSEDFFNILLHVHIYNSMNLEYHHNLLK